MSQSAFTPPYATVPPVAPQPVGSRLPLCALGVGVAAVVVSWVPFLGLLAGLVAIVLSAVALAKMMRKATSAAGLGLGIAALVVNVLVTAAFGSAVSGQVNASATEPAATTEAAGPAVVGTETPAAGAATPAAAPTTGPPPATLTTEAGPPAVQHTTKAPATRAPTTSAVSAEQQNAVRSAQGYLELMAFYGVTKAGL